MSDGYGFWWQGGYWASLTTGGRAADAWHDIIFGPVGANTHGHVWVEIPENGPQAMGSRLKDRGDPASPGFERASFSTQPVIRGRATWDVDNGAVTTEITDILSGSAYTAAPVTSVRTQSSRDPARVDLGVPTNAKWFDFELAITSQPATEAHATTRILAFGGGSPLGVRLSVTSWGSE
jgi:hypothetical protein